MVIQLILGAILGISFGWLADDGFFGDSEYIVDGVAVAIIVFLIVEAILIETGWVREYEHMLKKADNTYMDDEVSRQFNRDPKEEAKNIEKSRIASMKNAKKLAIKEITKYDPAFELLEKLKKEKKD